MFSIPQLLVATPALVVVSVICYGFYNLFLHPLRSFPGPKKAAVSQLWHSSHVIKGDLPSAISKLHNIYGSVVRVAPNEVSYINSQAWTDIYGVRNKPEFLKFTPDEGFHGAQSFLSAPTEKHRPIRKLLSLGFSEKALREQEPTIQRFINLLVHRCRENCNGGLTSIDMVAWINFFTFDLIGQLAYGESFDCLNKPTYHSWVDSVSHSLEPRAWFFTMSQYPLVSRLSSLLIPEKLLLEQKANEDLAIEKTKARLRSTENNLDFFHNLLQSKICPSGNDLYATSSVMIFAGSETTSTVISTLIYSLLKNPRTYDLLINEIRGAFTNEDEICVLSTSHFKYLTACLDEALRMLPPAAGSLARFVPPGGGIVNGKWLPAGTIVGVHHYAAYRSPKNFADPDSFIPERWLGDERFKDDSRDVFQPFSFGPRNCIGQNLAYAEMRLVMTRILWNFNLRLDPISNGWDAQKNFFIWMKKPLLVYLTPRSISDSHKT